MTEQAKKCSNDVRDFKTGKVYRCQEREGTSHAGKVCHQGNVWWPNGRPNVNPNFISRANRDLAMLAASKRAA